MADKDKGMKKNGDYGFKKARGQKSMMTRKKKKKSRRVSTVISSHPKTY